MADDMPIDAAEGKDDESKKKDESPLAPASAVFGSFGKTGNVTLLRFLGIFCAVLSGCLYPLLAFYFAVVFEDLLASTDGANYLANIREIVYVFMVLGAIGGITVSGQSFFLELAASHSTTDLKIQWFNALLRQDMAYYDIKDVSSQATIVSVNAARYKKGSGRKLGEGIQFFITALGGFGYAFYASWSVSLIILATVPFMAGSAIFVMAVTTKQTERKNKNYAAAGGIVYNTISSIRTVFSLNAPEKMIHDFEEATQKAYDSAVSFTYWVGLGSGSMMGSFILAYLALTLYGTSLLYNQIRSDGCDPSNTVLDNNQCATLGSDVFGALLGVTFAATGVAQISAAIEGFLGARAACYPALLAIHRKVDEDSDAIVVMDPESLEGEAKDSDKEVPLPKYLIDSSSDEGLKPSSVKGDLEFRNVSFVYPTRAESKVFNRFSLKIEAGKTVALVGPSGGGKSTTVSLIERFYDPTSGSVTLDGNDLKDLNVQWLRDQIGLVSQEPILFARSIRENISYGCPTATDEQVQQVAMAANAHNFITSFPDGYDTEVGDKGAQLSGGQKQRIAIARILLKNPTILLLDEATSALDSESEYVVQQALDDLLGKGNRTTIVIAHRLSTIRNADVIAVVKDGGIVEQGSHDELLAMGGEYSKLVEAQAPKVSSDDSVASTLEDSSYAETKIDAPQIQFNDVKFHYPSRPNITIFDGLNLSVKNGETLAIVGPSGGGKSTIVQMIERFYDPLSGSVHFEGTNLKDLNVQWLRDQLGFVSQEPTLFNTTIGENIKYGFPSATQSDIEAAAKQANAHDFIMSFPKGYDTKVGENATQVSGGQKQRIAIARALIKKPKCLLLDEATSALDSKSEAIVQEAIDQLMASKNQTVIIIAHRLSTIRNADRIAVVADGVIKEIGPHNYLMSKSDGRYKRLVQFNNLGGGMKDKKTKKEQDDKDDKKDDKMDEEEEIGKEKAKELAGRAKTLAKGEWGLFFIGGIGAVFAGLFFPGMGIVFAFMLELLFRQVHPCVDGTVSIYGFTMEYDSCQAYWDGEADTLTRQSYYISLAWAGLIASTIVGNVLLYYGFGTATEKMNKRVRDAVFTALMKQEVAYYDSNPIGNLSSQIEDDAAMMHSFSGEPIRTLVMSTASVLVGLVVAFCYMWPFALVFLGILPFMGFGAYMEMKMYLGEDEGNLTEDDDVKGSSGSIVIETLLSIRTVASLTIEKMREKEYKEALIREDPSSVKAHIMKSSGAGVALFIQFWGIALLFWWGGYLLANYSGTFTQRGFMISMWGLLYSLSGMSVAVMGVTDQVKAKAAANRIFALIDRVSPINALSDEGKKMN